MSVSKGLFEHQTMRVPGAVSYCHASVRPASRLPPQLLLSLFPFALLSQLETGLATVTDEVNT
jgi:hypothetical protein